jgi:hypothetical protein
MPKNANVICEGSLKLYDEEFSTHSFRTLAGVVFGE